MKRISWRESEVRTMQRLGIFPMLVIDDGFARVAYVKQMEDGTMKDVLHIVKQEFGDMFETTNYRIQCELECIEAVGEKEFIQLMEENNVTH